MGVDAERECWELRSGAGVGPLRFGMSPTEVAQAFTMTATSWDADGNPLGTEVHYVRNVMNTRSGWKNLGTVVDTRTGEDVPTS